MALRAHAFIATIAHTSSPPPPATTKHSRCHLTLQQKRKIKSRQLSLASTSPKSNGRLNFFVRGSLGGETGVPPEVSEYVEASIMEAAEVRTGPDGFRLTMNDGTHLPCHYIHPTDLRAAPTGPLAALVLRLNDGSGIMLPIIVVDYPRAMVMDAMKNIPMIRPTVYQVMKEMVTFLGYKIQMVRVTHRENDSYFARLYLEKGTSGGEGEEVISLDMRPSDAINLAVRAKVPIEVKRALALKDGVVAAVPSLPMPSSPVKQLGPGADIPSEDPCITSEEFGMVRSIAIAALLERYTEAAQLKEELAMFRASLGISMGEEGGGGSGSGSLQQQDQNDFWEAHFPDWFSFVDQCSTMAKAIGHKIMNAGKEEAIADARRRFTILLEKS